MNGSTIHHHENHSDKPNAGIMTVNAFARHIGLPRGENLYQIKKEEHAK